MRTVIAYTLSKLLGYNVREDDLPTTLEFVGGVITFVVSVVVIFSIGFLLLKGGLN